MSILKEKYWDLCAGLFLFIFSIALFYGGMTVKTLEVSSFGSGFFPKVVAVMLGITSLAITFGGIKKARAPDDGAKAPVNPRWTAVVATFVIMLGYAILLPILGFMITTTIYLVLQMNLLTANEKRNQILFAIISVISAVVIYYTFVKVFNLMLPAGILG